MVITENLVRKIIRETLGSAILSEARRASSWEEYVEFTPDNEPDQYANSDQVQEFVNTYQDFVNKVQKLREDAKTSSAAKAALAVVDDPKAGFQIIEGQTDSYDDYINWYRRFNSSDVGVATRSGVNADPPGQKYLHAYQIEVVLFGLLAQINDLTKVVKRVEAAQEAEPDNPEVQDEEVVKSKFKQWLERDKKERFVKIKEKLAARKARVKKRRAERKSGKKKSGTGRKESAYDPLTLPDPIPNDHPVIVYIVTRDGKRERPADQQGLDDMDLRWWRENKAAYETRHGGKLK
jgi:hypothetical protein